VSWDSDAAGWCPKADGRLGRLWPLGQGWNAAHTGGGRRRPRSHSEPSINTASAPLSQPRPPGPRCQSRVAQARPYLPIPTSTQPWRTLPRPETAPPQGLPLPGLRLAQTPQSSDSTRGLRVQRAVPSCTADHGMRGGRGAEALGPSSDPRPPRRSSACHGRGAGSSPRSRLKEARGGPGQRAQVCIGAPRRL
jgi:hypothetical protein